MIWIRADAGREVGTGHVMRCLAIALEAAKIGQKVCFLVADEESREFLATKGIFSDRGNPRCRVLGTDFRRMESELGIMGEILQEEAGPILVDSYFATQEYLQALGKITFVAYMDDNHLFPYPVDLIVNYNIYAESFDYGREQPERGAKRLLGPKYAPLRREFQGIAYQVRPKARKILLTTGGADCYDLSGQILDAMLGAEGFGEREICVVSGAMNSHYEELARRAEEDERIRLYRNVSCMSQLMADCDLAITAGGSTVYELCAVGVPFVCFSFVENQERIVKHFAGRELTAFGGDYLRQKEEMIPQLLQKARELMEDFEKRQAYSSAQRRLADGLGALRIAEELAACGESSIG